MDSPTDPRRPDAARALLYRWRFGSAEFDEARFELRVGGVLVELQQKPLQVLALLLAHASEVVAKDRILDSVWKHPTGDAPLANAVSKLRSALGEANAAAIATVARQGYKFDGPLERVAAGRRLASRMDLAAGSPVPGREHFLLVRLLGSSHTNETWLARQPRTGDQRVFKFAVSGERLAELKREVTLFRVLREALGERPDIARVLDWNLEQPPFWLECEYGGSSLAAWAAEEGVGEGGRTRLAAAAPELRLSLLLQAADAVAAAHGAGVLHKDIKPANVLVAPAPGGGWQLRLTDFGSGRLLEPERLEALRITQLGMTMAPGTDSASGTPYYLAPELLRGEPPSTRSDVFALGVMLYQLVAGDLQRPLAPGWEREIDDPVLQADIAAATDVDPRHRLASATELAARLRALPARRAQHAVESVRAQQSARARRRRPWWLAAAAVLVLGTGASLWAWHAEKRAAAALAQQFAVADALNRLLRDDLIAAANPAASGRADITVADALRAAAAGIDTRFGREQPAVRAGLHAAVQGALSNLSRHTEAVAAGRHAVAAFESAPEPDVAALQQARLRLVVDLVQLSQLDEARQVVRAIEAAPPVPATRTPAFRAQLLYARSWLTGGELALKESAALLEEALALVHPLTEDSAPGREKILFGLADNWMLLGRHAESQALYRELLDEQIRRHGSDHARTNVTRMGLGTALMQTGHDEEARALLEQARGALGRTLGPDHRLTLNARDGLAMLQFKAGHFDAAATEWAAVQVGFARLMGADSSYTLTAETNRAMALRGAGRAGPAEALLREALARARRNLKEDAPQVQQIRYTLAEVLLDQRRRAEVPALIEGLDPAALNEAQQEPDWPARLATLRRR